MKNYRKILAYLLCTYLIGNKYRVIKFVHRKDHAFVQGQIVVSERLNTWIISTALRKSIPR